MAKEEHLFKLAKIAIISTILSSVLLILCWMVLQHNPTKITTSMNLQEQSIDFSCEFASETPEK